MARHYGAYVVETSNEDKVLFPHTGMTKGELIDYYERAWQWMRPHLERRALVMQRFPDGIEEEGFYQKEVGDYFPDWVSTVAVDKRGGRQHLVVCENQGTLAFLADQACITPHLWLSRTDRIHHPDQLIVDLDPPGDDFEPVRRAARRCRELFDDLGLSSFLKTTGSRGVHVLVLLDRSEPFDRVRDLARRAMQILAERHPEELTLEQRKDKRGGRLFLDLGRNAYAQTAVAPYAVRARAGAPVATPIDWDELGDVGARSFTVKNIFRRLGQRDDPWQGLYRHAQSLSTARKRLEEMD